MSKKSTITQTLVNAFPDWSDTRTDEQSLGQQFINVLGNRLEDLHEQIALLGKNYFLTTANTQDIDVIYKFALPQSFTFDVDDNDQSSRQFTTLTVSGQKSNVWYNIVQASGNDIESFWYTSTPSRITTSGYPVLNTIEDDVSQKIISGIVTDWEYNSPIFPLTSGVYLDTPNHLWIQILDGTQFINIDDNNQPTRGLVTLTGITRKGTEETESIVFIHNDIQKTSKEWSKLSKIDVQNIIDPSSTKVRVLEHRFGREHSPQLPPIESNYNFVTSPGSKQQIPIMWDVDTTNPILYMKTYAMDDLRDRISNLLDLTTLRSWELLQRSGSSTIGTPIDLALEPFSHKLWVIDNNNYLYLFNDEMSLPNMGLMTKKQFDCMAVIEPSSYHITNNSSVTLTFFWRRPIKDMARHRVYVTAPNGTRYSIANGVMTTLDLNGTWVYGSPDNRLLRNNVTLTLAQRGDWIFSMDTVYVDGTEETDQRIVSVDYKIAEAQFLIPLDAGYSIKGIDFDSDQQMWIAATNGTLYKKYRITIHSDVMMIDYDNKVLLLKEEYDQIKVVV